MNIVGTGMEPPFIHAGNKIIIQTDAYFWIGFKQNGFLIGHVRFPSDIRIGIDRIEVYKIYNGSPVQ
ncbi:hypothetical protein D3C85_1147850 [compost metagenome]